ncbi:MAG: HAMP domain-containing sensor histidine kinase [Candidatus Omnitrophica bacterium]|nr:HAMP domain-containing sensor histidine kinase [Candidatus Omnitrophota bacterium]
MNEEQKEFLDVAKRNVDRLARLINDVLDFQKLESGKMVFNTQENDMNSVVREIVKNMMPVSNKKGLGLILALDDKLPLVRFDRDKIIQVLTNLVNNALKFTEKGNVTIATSLGDNIIRVSVKDTGPGIKKEDLPRLFRQFEQLDKSSERKTSGTGLGLAISKEIIEKHKGKIWADSEPGKGTTFSFVLPVKERRIL